MPSNNKPQPGILTDAQRVFPKAVVCLLVSILCWIVTRNEIVKIIAEFFFAFYLTIAWTVCIVEMLMLREPSE